MARQRSTGRDHEQRGGQTAAEDIAERAFALHHRDVFRYALRRTADEWAAEEVVADVFAVAWRRSADIPEEALPWLLGIARHVIFNQKRSGRRLERLRASLRIAGDSHAPSTESIVESSELVRGVLAELSEGDREVLTLVAWDGLEPQAAALVLGCSAGAFRVRLLRARRRLERALEQRGLSTERTPSEEGADRHGT